MVYAPSSYGHKRRYRIIDFKRSNSYEAKVIAIEYDPNRTARIALVQYEDGEKNYIVAPDGLKVGEVLHSSNDAEIKTGNTMQISSVPVGTFIHNIELKPGKGGQLVRSAGASAQIVAKDKGYCQVKLPSGEVRMIKSECKATLGVVGNIEH